jgi:multidrug efflux pump subunit AcrA (membrane-fusion protein)
VRTDPVLDLAECTTFRQTLLARPPRIVHGTALLLAGLLGAALAWAALTPTDLVVRAAGRVRPPDTPKKVFSAARGEVLSGSTGGRAVAVHFREGDAVAKGALLLRLDTTRLDNEIAKKKRAIRAGENELARLARSDRLLRQQHELARTKAQDELAQAEEEVRQEKSRRRAEISAARAELERAADEEQRIARLVPTRAATLANLVEARAKLREAEARLAKAEVRVAQCRLKALRRAVDLTEKDYALKRQDLTGKHAAKRAELKLDHLDLASLELERRQAEIRAPIAGVVTRGDVKVGDVLEPGKPVVEIAPQTGFLFEAAVPSEEVGRLRLGMAARIKLDAYDYQRYGTLRGTVCFVSPDSGLAEGRQQAVYTVRIALSSAEVGRGEFRGRVKLGMAGQVDIVTGGESLLSLLLKRIRQTISLG